MITQQTISTVIDAQAAIFNRKDKGIEREQLSYLPQVESFATIICGIRRCGKSTLMQQYLAGKEGSSLFLSFEDIRLVDFDAADFARLLLEIQRREVKSLFFDEIQIIDKWEIFAHQLLNEGYQLFITGSNASLLSKELGTHLTGRHISIELFPFSYLEFVKYKQFTIAETSFAQYLTQGGFPDYLRTQMGDVLQTLLDDILMRDIAVRYSLRDVKSLRQLVVYLISNIGKPVSASNLAKTLDFKSVSTVLEYFSHLQNAYLIDFIPMFDYSLKAQLRNPKKVYVTDLGLFNEVATTFTDELGRRLENTVFMHFRRKTKELYYFKQKGECDFIVFGKNNQKQCIQVCYEFNDLNAKREIGGLIEALQFFDLPSGAIVTFNQKDQFTENGKLINIIPAHELLSQKG